jgi:hypothetical protein
LLIDPDGSFTYLPDDNFSGPDQFGFLATDGLLTTSGTVALTIAPVNQPPMFGITTDAAKANPVVSENSGAYSQTWAVNPMDGADDPVGQSLVFLVSNDNSSLFNVQPAVDATGNLTFTPASNAFGTANVTVQITDGGSTADGGEITSAAKSFAITISFVNQPPSFNAGSDQSINENAGQQTVRSWATNVSHGQSSQDNQTLMFVVAYDNTIPGSSPALFSVPPAIDPTSGDLTYTPAMYQHGAATVTATLEDSAGGTDSHTFTITVNQVSQAPTFTAANITVPENAQRQFYAGWATRILPGVPGDSTTGFQLVVTGDSNPSLIPLPTTDYTAGSPTADLSFTPNANQSGTATITSQLTDQGVTTTQTFNVTVVPPSGLVVTAVQPTDTGFTATFSESFNASLLHMYDTAANGLRPADVTLVGARVGPVGGSLVVDPANEQVTFIATSGVLPADTYTYVLRSAADGFETASGTLLTGTDGNLGDNVTGTFTVLPTPGAVTVSLPSFARGPNQPVNVPAMATTGIPLTVSQASGITSLVVDIDYNPALLNITGATTSIAGASVTPDLSVSGVAQLTFTSATPLAAATNEDLIDLQATVPASAAADYTADEILAVRGVNINGGAIPALEGDALHVVADLGDVNADQAYTPGDATLIDRVFLNLDSGFVKYRLVDPEIVGDVLGGGITPGSATQVDRAFLNEPTPKLPSLVTVAGPTADEAMIAAAPSDQSSPGPDSIETAAPAPISANGPAAAVSAGAVASAPQTAAPSGAIALRTSEQPQLSGDEQFIAQAYERLLGRMVDTAGLTYWAGALSQGRSRADIVRQLMASDERLADVVQSAYGKFLGRSADAAGLAYWTAQLRQGLDETSLDAHLLASDEYSSNHGPADDNWLLGVFADLLGHPADAASAAYWEAQLAAGISRVAIAQEIESSAEYVGRVIQSDYVQYLGRDAGLTEVVYWAGQVASGTPLAQVPIALAESDEFIAKPS